MVYQVIYQRSNVLKQHFPLRNGKMASQVKLVCAGINAVPYFPSCVDVNTLDDQIQLFWQEFSGRNRELVLKVEADMVTKEIKKTISGSLLPRLRSKLIGRKGRPLPMEIMLTCDNDTIINPLDGWIPKFKRIRSGREYSLHYAYTQPNSDFSPDYITALQRVEGGQIHINLCFVPDMSYTRFCFLLPSQSSLSTVQVKVICQSDQNVWDMISTTALERAHVNFDQQPVYVPGLSVASFRLFIRYLKGQLCVWEFRSGIEALEIYQVARLCQNGNLIAVAVHAFLQIGKRSITYQVADAFVTLVHTCAMMIRANDVESKALAVIRYIRQVPQNH